MLKLTSYHSIPVVGSSNAPAFVNIRRPAGLDTYQIGGLNEVQN